MGNSKRDKGYLQYFISLELELPLDMGLDL